MGHPSRRFAEKAGYQRKVRCRCGAGASAGVDGYTSAATTVHDTPARAVERTLAAITPASVAAYAEVARPAFVLKSCVMILLSAVVASRSPAAVMQPLVWAAASITACITGGSMMVNDYFDWKSGVDKINNPGRAIPRCVRITPALDSAPSEPGCMRRSPAARGRPRRCRWGRMHVSARMKEPVAAARMHGRAACACQAAAPVSGLRARAQRQRHRKSHAPPNGYRSALAVPLDDPAGYRRSASHASFYRVLAARRSAVGCRVQKQSESAQLMDSGSIGTGSTGSI